MIRRATRDEVSVAEQDGGVPGFIGLRDDEAD
jgi:hypothetical protein